MTVPSSIKVPVKSIRTSGALNLVQRGAIDDGIGLWDFDVRTKYNDDFFVNLESQTIDEFIYSYQTTRSETTSYDYNKFVQYGAKSDGVSPYTNYVDIEMIVKIPTTQEVIYVPGFWTIIKFGWIQYFCALIFWYYVLYEGFFASLVRAHVFETSVKCNFNE